MRYIICGLEHTGLRIIEALLDLKEDITLITLNRKEPTLFFIRDRISHYVEGDARSPEILRSAGIDRADFFLIFTSNEIKNIEINCKAKEINPAIKTAVLIRNQNYSAIIRQGFEVDYVFHIPSMVAFSIASSCINKNILHTFASGKDKYYLGYINCREFSFLQDKTIQEVEESFGIRVIYYFSRNNLDQAFSGTRKLEEESSFVYLTNKDSGFEKKIFTTPRLSYIDQIITEISRRFDFLKHLSLSEGIRKVILLYTILILVSVFVFKACLGLSVIDSVYFVITTTSTVGYGDINLLDAPFWLKLYGSVVMLAGAALLAMLFSVLTDNIISRRLGRYVGFHHLRLKNHIVVAGIGSIGLGVVNYLTRLHIKMVVIEKNPDNPNISLFRSKVPVLIGDASDPKILLKAGIKNARSLAALIDDDLNNVNIILKGNNMNGDLHTVARIFNHELNRKATTTFKIDNVVSASLIAVPQILGSLMFKDILWSGYIQGRICSIFRLPMENRFLDKDRIRLIREFNLFPVMAIREGSVLPVTDETVFRKEDRVYVFSEFQHLFALHK